MEVIRQYFPGLDSGQAERFEALAPLYAEWNAKINVISRKDIDQLYLRHVLHSLAIARIVSFRKGTSILDAGTGGGFPGLSVHILFPKTTFYSDASIGMNKKED